MYLTLFQVFCFSICTKVIVNCVNIQGLYLFIFTFTFVSLSIPKLLVLKFMSAPAGDDRVLVPVSVFPAPVAVPGCRPLVAGKWRPAPRRRPETLLGSVPSILRYLLSILGPQCSSLFCQVNNFSLSIIFYYCLFTSSGSQCE